MLKRPEGIPVLRDYIERCSSNGWNTSLDVVEGVWGVALIIQGQIRNGIQRMEQTILRCDREGFSVLAEVYRIFLCRVNLEILSREEKLPLFALLRNAPTLIATIFTAQRRICALAEKAR
jgi:hypothetical protein